MQLRTRRCFNDSFYFERNKDLALVPGVDPWKHFVQYGQFEGRPHRQAAAPKRFQNAYIEAGPETLMHGGTP